jgi:hypothetical protein
VEYSQNRPAAPIRPFLLELTQSGASNGVVWSVLNRQDAPVELVLEKPELIGAIAETYRPYRRRMQFVMMPVFPGGQIDGRDYEGVVFTGMSAINPVDSLGGIDLTSKPPPPQVDIQFAAYKDDEALRLYVTIFEPDSAYLVDSPHMDSLGNLRQASPLAWQRAEEGLSFALAQLVLDDGGLSHTRARTPEEVLLAGRERAFRWRRRPGL